MGYASVIAPCAGCGRPFYFNPHKVPSIRINGVKEPVCARCMAHVNTVRREAGVPELTVHPDAYGPLDENEL